MRALRPVVGSALLLLAGCGSGGSDRASTHTVRFDVGGAVVYAGNPAEMLAGVDVTLTSIDGIVQTATTNTFGLWSISGLSPGIYGERYALDGYEPVTATFGLEAFGENDIRNPFVVRPTVAMNEPPLRALLLPFDVSVEDGDDLRDGIGGVEVVYRPVVDGAIQVVFDQRLVGGGFAFLEDGITGDFLSGTLDSAAGTTFTFYETDIDLLNGGTGLTTDGDPFTWHSLYVSGDAYTPIHGDAVFLDALVGFNTDP